MERPILREHISGVGNAYPHGKGASTSRSSYGGGEVQGRVLWRDSVLTWRYLGQISTVSLNELMRGTRSSYPPAAIDG